MARHNAVALTGENSAVGHDQTAAKGRFGESHLGRPCHLDPRVSASGKLRRSRETAFGAFPRPRAQPVETVAERLGLATARCA
jgi:hypothetical protein